MEKISILYKILGNEFYGFIVLFANSKDVLSWLVIFGKLIENLIDKKWFWKFSQLCEMLGYLKFLWNYLEANYEFQFHLTMSLMWFLLLCRDRCDYPSRCCNPCDIGILTPHFMAIWCLRGIIWCLCGITWCLCGITDVFLA